MTAHHHKDLIAWQLADAFKREIFRLVKNSSPASRNLRYHDQIVNAASDVGKDIVEGFGRKAPLEFAKFLDYAVASLARVSEILCVRHRMRRSYAATTEKQDA